MLGRSNRDFVLLKGSIHSLGTGRLTPLAIWAPPPTGNFDSRLGLAEDA